MPSYAPILSPPTPAPSPQLQPLAANLPASFRSSELIPISQFALLTPSDRLAHLSQLLSQCTARELNFVSRLISPHLKRDFLKELPQELALCILHFVDDVEDLVLNVGAVSRHWRQLSQDESIWRRMCLRWHIMSLGGDLPLSTMPFSFMRHFKMSYITKMNWEHGGRLMCSDRFPIIHPDQGVVTSLAMDDDWIVVGLASCKVHVFNRRTGVRSRTLVGCQAGVWAVWLIGSGGTPHPKDNRSQDDSADASMDNIPHPLRTRLDVSCAESGTRPGQFSSASSRTNKVCSSSEGWGQQNAVIVSGGCDKVVRVWDAESGFCIYVLEGHTSTIRCIGVLAGRPIAVSGSRDSTLRVWDIQRGRLLQVLEGHRQSVRCLDLHGSKVISGSYDCTCRVWDVDSGQCLHVLRGHFNEIYCVAFDGTRIVSAGLDTTVRIWDPDSGQCLALLQGHTTLVCQLQLSSTLLATGGSDGRVITFSLESYSTLRDIPAHDSSVTALQFHDNFLVTGGNDGRVKLSDLKTGKYIRDLTDKADCVWKVGYRNDVCTVMCKRGGKTVMEFWDFRAEAGTV